MKILVTGNKNRGVAKAIYENLGEYEVDCVSRKSWNDLMIPQERTVVANQSISYDVFINCSKLDDFCQTLLLKEVHDHWIHMSKSGHIINIGSTVDTGLKGGSRLYTVEKVALRNLSRKLTYDAIGGSGIKVTYISLGYLDTEGVSFKDKVKIDLSHVTDTIEWILECPDYININEISADPIQKERV